MQSATPSQEVNPRKLFVGNLPFNATQEELEAHFSQFGELAENGVKLIIDKMTGRSKGFAFVEFTTKEAADDAVAKSNDMEFGGRNMVVNVARPIAPRTDRPQRGGYGNDRGGSSFGGGDRGGYRGGSSDRSSRGPRY